MFENQKRKRQVAKWVDTWAFKSSLDPEFSVCVTDADMLNGMTRLCFADAVLQLTQGEQATVTLPLASAEIGTSRWMGELFFRLEEWQSEYEGAFKAALAAATDGTDSWASETEAGSFELEATLAVLKQWAQAMLAETHTPESVTATLVATGDRLVRQATLDALARLQAVPGITLAGDLERPVMPLAFTLVQPTATTALADLEAAYTGQA